MHTHVVQLYTLHVNSLGHTSAASTLALAASSAVTTSTYPLSQAAYSGVQPLEVCKINTKKYSRTLQVQSKGKSHTKPTLVHIGEEYATSTPPTRISISSHSHNTTVKPDSNTATTTTVVHQQYDSRTLACKSENHAHTPSRYTMTMSTQSTQHITAQHSTSIVQHTHT